MDAQVERALAARGGWFVEHGKGGYPDLGTLPDPPGRFYVRGSLGGAGRGPEPPAVAVVGSRRVDPAAIELARAIGFALARAGLTVVSGGALGIDAAAHAGALEAGGQTVAVVAGGVLHPGPPRNRRLFASMLAAGGGICSEDPPDAHATPWAFTTRNRLIAALARAVVVVRAREGSGCKYTVEAARTLGRPVLVVPPPPRCGAMGAYGAALLAGDLFPEGTGIQPVRDPAEVLAALGLGRPAAAGPAGLERGERLVLDALGAGPLALRAIAATSGIPEAEVARVVARLCARGLVRPAGPGRFVAQAAGTP